MSRIRILPETVANRIAAGEGILGGRGFSPGARAGKNGALAPEGSI